MNEIEGSMKHKMRNGFGILREKEEPYEGLGG